MQRECKDWIYGQIVQRTYMITRKLDTWVDWNIGMWNDMTVFRTLC